MKVIKSKILRMLALAAAFLLSLYSAAQMLMIMDEYDDINGCRFAYIQHRYNEDAESLFVRLWLAGNMYLARLDENGRMVCTDTLKDSIYEQMRKCGITDRKDSFVFRGTELEYYAEYNGHILTNTDADDPEKYFRNSGYAVMFENDRFDDGNYISFPEISGDLFWFATDYGKFYFDTGLITAAAYSFDTSDCDVYYDYDGTSIFYREDGKMPVPFDEYSKYRWSDDEKYISYYGDTSPLKIYLAPNSYMIAEYEESQTRIQYLSEDVKKRISRAVSSAAAAAVLVIYVLVFAGYSGKSGKYETVGSDRVFTGIPLAVMILSAAAAVCCVCPGNSIRDAADDISFNGTYEYILLLAVFAAGFTGFMWAAGCAARKLRCGTFVSGMAVVRLFRHASNVYQEFSSLRSFSPARRLAEKTVFFAAAGYAVALVIGFRPVRIWPVRSFMVMAAAALVIVLYTRSVMKDFIAYQKIGEHVHALREGDYSVRENDSSSPLYAVTDDLNNISAGIKETVEKKVSAERMKIDLITNVSHDLKTPLTSVISYIDLLMAEKLPEEAESYVKILAQKSERLRELVTDVFDMAKATSGTDIKAEHIDMKVLAEQVTADMEDNVEKYHRELRKNIEDVPAPVYADGAKMYRVIQNVIDNALRYSLEGTRIYMKMYSENGYSVLSVKNTALYEMTFSPEEITERFVRGDASRTTEGNGLGLAIAKSFTEACGGSFGISIDGDVFTAEIRMKLEGSEAVSVNTEKMN